MSIVNAMKDDRNWATILGHDADDDVQYLFCLYSRDYSLIVDALFGFSFKPPVRPQFSPILETLAEARDYFVINNIKA